MIDKTKWKNKWNKEGNKMFDKIMSKINVHIASNDQKSLLFVIFKMHNLSNACTCT